MIIIKIICPLYSTGASGMQSHHPELRSQAGSSTSSSPGLTCKSINQEAGYISGDEEWMEPPLSKVQVLHTLSMRSVTYGCMGPAATIWV